MLLYHQDAHQGNGHEKDKLDGVFHVRHLLSCATCAYINRLTP